MDWPTTLPSPVVDGFTLQPDAGLVRSDMESGPPRQRKCYSDGADTVQATWRFTLAEMAAFRAFFKTDISGGAAWFNMTIHDGTSAGLVSRAVRFVGGQQNQPWRASLLDKMVWEVTASLEIRDA